MDSGGRERSAVSRVRRNERREVRQAWERGVLRDCGCEFRRRVSPSKGG